MIKDINKIQIKSSPEAVFDLIEKMPNKFPIYKIFEAKPFLFLRILFVDGFRSAIDAASIEKPDDELVLSIGDNLGPFKLTEVEKPFKYYFTLKSFFINCRTGYSIYDQGDRTDLSFDLIAENPTFFEKVYWFFIKPFHYLFAKKVLQVIKQRAEKNDECSIRI